MIDLETGRIEINGVVIEPHFMMHDFEKYGKEKVDIHNRGNGRGIISILEFVNSNGIDAEVYIEINEKLDARRVIITPVLSDSEEMTLLEASKLWLKGMANGNYIERPNSISGSYGWGYIAAQYRRDRDYGVIGGEIIIEYKE